MKNARIRQLLLLSVLAGGLVLAHAPAHTRSVRAPGLVLLRGVLPVDLFGLAAVALVFVLLVRGSPAGDFTYICLLLFLSVSAAAVFFHSRELAE